MAMITLQSILLLGCGNMGGAMLKGWLAAGLDASRFTIVDPALPAAPDGVRLLRTLPDERFDAILLGVKPQMLGDVAGAVEPYAGPDTVLLSILAGVELDSLWRLFPRARIIVRVMPNLAAALGKSPIALASQGLPEGDLRQTVTDLVAPLGQVEWLDEKLFDLVTALAGSGPAFVYRFIDALASGAKALGMSGDQAERLALSMVEGAAVLAAQSGESPGDLARRVASPGGTTEAGLQTLDAGGALACLMEATLRAARDRGTQLALNARVDGPAGNNV